MNAKWLELSLKTWSQELTPRLHLHCRVELIALHLRCPIRGMPMGLSVFVPVMYESQFVHVPQYKIALCCISPWWEVGYILTIHFPLGRPTWYLCHISGWRLKTWSRGAIPPAFTSFGNLSLLFRAWGTPKRECRRSQACFWISWPWVMIYVWLPTIKWLCTTFWLDRRSVK